MNSPSEGRPALLAIACLAALLASAVANPADARGRRDPVADESVLSRPPGAPLLAIVSLSEQRVTIYDAGGRILRAPVSTGRSGYETPAGIYSVIQKEAEHYSNLYDDASMPFMQRITWSGIALHAGALPGHPASHGCIRMPYDFAERLFDLTKLGMRVIVVRNDMAPAAIAHPLLFQTKPMRGELVSATQPADGPTQPMRLGAVDPRTEVAPPTDASLRPMPLKSIAAAKAAEADAAARAAEEARQIAAKLQHESARTVRGLRMANAARMRAESQLTIAERAVAVAGSPEASEQAEQAKAKAVAAVAEADAQLDAAKAEAQPKADAAARGVEAAKAAEAAKVAALQAAKEATERLAPVSVFISRQTQRLYVRKAFRQVLESPVTIRDPDTPIGTHIFTAVDEGNESAGVRWSVVSMYGNESPEPAAKGRPQRIVKRTPEPVATDVGAAKSALDRIDIPQDALDRISEIVSPGSSLIVSDEAASRETGKGTDFIVVMSGEPQGGIKIRRRPEPWSGYDRSYQRSPYGYGGGMFRW